MKGPGINPEMGKGRGYHYTNEMGTKNPSTCVIMGTAASTFSVEQGRAVARSTLHKVKKAYLSILKMRMKDLDKIKSLLHASRGRPLL